MFEKAYCWWKPVKYRHWSSHWIISLPGVRNPTRPCSGISQTSQHVEWHRFDQLSLMSQELDPFPSSHLHLGTQASLPTLSWHLVWSYRAITLAGWWMSRIMGDPICSFSDDSREVSVSRPESRKQWTSMDWRSACSWYPVTHRFAVEV